MNTIQYKFYIGANCIASRISDLGERSPLLRQTYPSLFAWHKEMPLQAYITVATSVSIVFRFIYISEANASLPTDEV